MSGSDESDDTWLGGMDDEADVSPDVRENPLWEGSKGQDGDDAPAADSGLQPPLGYDFPEARADATSAGVMPAGEYRFLPVIGYIAGNASATLEGQEPLEVGGKRLTWWEDESIVPKYPYVLINPVGYTTFKDTHWTEAFRFEKGEQFILCDSGGYQMSTRENGEIVDRPEDHDIANVKLYPELIVDWQVRNADAGLILDVPPNYVEEGTKIPNNKQIHPARWRRDTFYEHLELTADHARRMSERLADLRDAGVPGAEDFKQLGVIHGRSTYWEDNEWGLLEASHQKMRDEMVSIDGFAMSPQPPHSLGQMALHMGFAMDRLDDVDYIHVLQGGGNTQRALLDYFSMISDFFVTSDASTHIRGTQWRQFYLPGTWNQEVITITERHGDQQVDRFPCTCSVCRVAADNLDVETITADHDALDGQLINMHNLHQSMGSARCISALLRKYGEDVVDDLLIEDGNVKGVREIHTESNNYTENQFWMVLVDKFSEGNIRRLHTSMRYLRDVKRYGLEGAKERGWEIPSTSERNVDEWAFQAESDALDW